MPFYTYCLRLLSSQCHSCIWFHASEVAIAYVDEAGNPCAGGANIWLPNSHHYGRARGPPYFTLPCRYLCSTSCSYMSRIVWVAIWHRHIAQAGGRSIDTWLIRDLGVIWCGAWAITSTAYFALSGGLNTVSWVLGTWSLDRKTNRNIRGTPGRKKFRGHEVICKFRPKS